MTAGWVRATGNNPTIEGKNPHNASDFPNAKMLSGSGKRFQHI
jgi:hypothetical protein